MMVRIFLFLFFFLGYGSFADGPVVDLFDLPHVVAGYYTKELCSCVFVVGQSESFCKEQVRDDSVILSGLKIDTTNKTVSALYIYSLRTSHYRGEKYGCVLE